MFPAALLSARVHQALVADFSSSAAGGEIVRAAGADPQPVVPADVRPRVDKPRGTQASRTRTTAEVFTPAWVCAKLNDLLDSAWRVHFPHAGWQDYVDDKRLEITCGEAPFLTSRYDASTGKPIPVAERCGLLDRKLAVLGRHCRDDKRWLQWARRAVESVYGFEYHGDSLFLARRNLLLSYAEHRQAHLGSWAPEAELLELAHVVSSNLWQMDGLGDQQCRLRDWRTQRAVYFADLQGWFGAVVGNPPYQRPLVGTSDSPIYPAFMALGYKLSPLACFITPGRFLFNAGKTSKAFNRTMLSDPHLSVELYEPRAEDIFARTTFTGGVAITLRNAYAAGRPIGTFIPDPTLKAIVDKVRAHNFRSWSEDIHLQHKLDLDRLYAAHPDLRDKVGSNGRERRLTTSIFATPGIFRDTPSAKDHLEILGLVRNKRVRKFIDASYIAPHPTTNCYTAVVPKSNGSALLVGQPTVAGPGVGFTQSFISFGAFSSFEEARNATRYLRTKFCRALLSSRKITQDNSPATWENVPAQDFSTKSPIDWDKPLEDIDRQLYAAYELSEEEIRFIESLPPYRQEVG